MVTNKQLLKKDQIYRHISMSLLVSNAQNTQFFKKKNGLKNIDKSRSLPFEAQVFKFLMITKIYTFLHFHNIIMIKQITIYLFVGRTKPSSPFEHMDAYGMYM